MKKLLLLLLGVPLVALGQPVPATTPFTRSFLRSADAAAARTSLSLVTSNWLADSDFFTTTDDILSLKDSGITSNKLATALIDPVKLSTAAKVFITNSASGLGVTNNQYLPGKPIAVDMVISNSLAGENIAPQTLQIFSTSVNHGGGESILYNGDIGWAAMAFRVGGAALSVPEDRARFAFNFNNDDGDPVNSIQIRETNIVAIPYYDSAYDNPIGVGNGPINVFQWLTNSGTVYGDIRGTTYINGTNFDLGGGALTVLSNGTATTGGPLYIGGAKAGIDGTNYFYDSSSQLYAAGFGWDGANSTFATPQSITAFSFIANSTPGTPGFTGDGAGVTNGSPALATNNAAATDGMVLSKTGDKLKLIPASGTGDAVLTGDQEFSGYNLFSGTVSNTGTVYGVNQTNSGTISAANYKGPFGGYLSMPVSFVDLSGTPTTNTLTWAASPGESQFGPNPLRAIIVGSVQSATNDAGIAMGDVAGLSANNIFTGSNTFSGNTAFSQSNYFAAVGIGVATIQNPITNTLMFATPGGSGPTNIWFIPDGNQTNAGTIQAAGFVGPLRYSTNANNGIPDFTKRRALFTTNNVVVLGLPISADFSLDETAVLFIRNTGATWTNITAPANVHTVGTWNVTNLSVVTLSHYGAEFTNAVALPIY